MRIFMCASVGGCFSAASQGGNEVALTLTDALVLAAACRASVGISLPASFALDTAAARSFGGGGVVGETSMRVAAAGLTGAATRGLLPTLLGVEVRARGPLGSPLRGKAAQEGLATAAEGASSFAEKPLAEAAHAEAGKAEKDKGLKGQRSEGNNRMAGLSEAPDVSMGLTFAFGEKGDLLVEPKFHLGERRVALDCSKRFSSGSFFAFHFAPSNCLRLRWADPAADGGFWVIAAEYPLQGNNFMAPATAAKKYLLRGLPALLSEQPSFPFSFSVSGRLQLELYGWRLRLQAIPRFPLY
ncbi:hypothetical protein cyc_01562 [Cyclospora cayetanensis]|uniref:Uncharacterized protein n=1 Tax=Cyclospora cayetanensis TaxID=88456 RepID=A0A1D3CX07_9EIME|nr:hypothetical protein cyc_01562 [Cyclospora cayetanensis]